jgi:hypothetical protein
VAAPPAGMLQQQKKQNNGNSRAAAAAYVVECEQCVGGTRSTRAMVYMVRLQMLQEHMAAKHQLVHRTSLHCQLPSHVLCSASHHLG